MPPTPPVSAPARSADELNERIRDMMRRSDGRLRPEQRPEYVELVALWAAAVRGEVTAAA